MAKLRVVYTRSHTIGGILIRWRDPYGAWSHCAVITPDNTVVESRAFHGVVETPLDEFLSRYPRYQIVDIECPNPDLGVAWARSQLGKGYDYLSIFGMALRRSWQSTDKWHCAELLEMASIKSGKERFRDSPSHISPNLSYWVI